MNRRYVALFLALALSVLVISLVSAQEKLGEVNFPVSCNDAAQKEFNRAMALFHSFWFDPAKKSFSNVLEHDPECGMAHWGIAIMSMGNPLAWPPNPNALKSAATEMAEAQRVGAKSGCLFS